jgi:hypothetical protein
MTIEVKMVLGVECWALRQAQDRLLSYTLLFYLLILSEF